MTIKEVANITGISADTLRYYERIGLIPPVPRNKNGIRDYTTSFVHWVRLVQQLKGIGMSLEAIIEYIDLAKSGDDTYIVRKQLLAKARADLHDKINRLRSMAEKADYEIKNYETELLPETESLIEQWSA